MGIQFILPANQSDKPLFHRHCHKDKIVSRYTIPYLFSLITKDEIVESILNHDVSHILFGVSYKSTFFKIVNLLSLRLASGHIGSLLINPTPRSKGNKILLRKVMILTMQHMPFQ
jgi:hypothetical protein